MPYPVCTGDLRLWKTQNLFSVWSVWRFRAPYIHRTSEKLMGTMQTQVAFLSSNSASGDVRSIENTSRMHDIYRIFKPVVSHPRQPHGHRGKEQTVETGKAPVFFPTRMPSGPRHPGYIPIRLWRIMMIVQQVHLPFHLLYAFHERWHVFLLYGWLFEGGLILELDVWRWIFRLCEHWLYGLFSYMSRLVQQNPCVAGRHSPWRWKSTRWWTVLPAKQQLAEHSLCMVTSMQH